MVLRRPRWLLVVCAGLLLSALYVTSTPLAGRIAMEWLEKKYPPTSASTCPTADVIAVLTGTGPARQREVRSNEAPNRAEVGIDLFHKGKAPLMLITSAGDEPPGAIEGMPPGVPVGQVVVTGWAKDTVDEARLIAELASQRRWHRVILVTSSFHLWRATALLRRAAEARGWRLEVVPHAADWRRGERLTRGQNPYLPSRQGQELFLRALREVVGLGLSRLGV